MNKKLRSCLLIILLVLVVMQMYACGEKNTFQLSSLEKEYTNIKLASLNGEEEVTLDEARTEQLVAMFEGLSFVQTQSGGKFTDKAYSLIFLDGASAVDYIQISDDGKTIAYGGYFYQLEDTTYDIENIVLLFEQQREEDAAKATDIEAETTEAEAETVVEENTKSVMEEEQDSPCLTDADFTEQKIVAIPVGETCTVDLDGDGKMETVIYEPQSSDGVSYEILFFIESEADNEYVDSLGDWSFENLITPSLDYYFIVDLDSTDPYREIALLDEGMSGDPEFHFLRYQEGEHIYLGSVFTDSSYDELMINGDGKIVGSGRLSILQTWNAPFTWVLEEGKIKLLEEDFYSPYVSVDSEQIVTQVEKITVYSEADLESEATELEPSDAVVNFGTTDNKNWVQFYRTDGVEGWIYLEEGCFIEVDGEKIPVSKVFENLHFAG